MAADAVAAVQAIVVHLLRDVKAMCQLHPKEAHSRQVEFEFRVGTLRPSGFDPTISIADMDTITQQSPFKFQEPYEIRDYIHQDATGRQVRTRVSYPSEGKGPPTVEHVVKTRLRNVDVPLPGSVYHGRISISEEQEAPPPDDPVRSASERAYRAAHLIPPSTTRALVKPKRVVFQHRRTATVSKVWRIDASVVWHAEEETQCELAQESSKGDFHMEIELADSATALQRYSCEELAHQLMALLKQLFDP